MATRRGRPRCRATFGALATALVGLLLVPGAALGASANVTVGSDGSVSIDLSGSIANGSAVRAAIDGNFTALVVAITSNSSQQTSILDSIATAESNLFLGSYFGNRDGTAVASEVDRFQQLLVLEAQLVPTGSLSGGSFLAFTLDGARATSTRLAGITFTNATGPVAAVGPIGVVASLAYSFPYSGSQHVLALTTNLTPTAVPLTLFTGSVGLSVTTPAGTSVTSTAGLDTVHVSNDAFGWGTSSISGSFTPTTTGVLSIAFGAAFPVGDLLIATPIVAVGALAAGLYLRRRRRRRTGGA